jgi:hypothetical protein
LKHPHRHALKDSGVHPSTNAEKLGICTYCGLEKALTRDHVPPKLLLAKPYPQNLLTVPSCLDCNGSFQEDDEYTRVIAAIDMRAAENQDARSKLPAIMRSLQKPEAAAFAQYLKNHMSKTLVLGPSGNPMAEATEVDRKRVNATGTRLLKALIFVETGRRLSQTDQIRIAAGAGVTPTDPLILQFARVYQRCSEHRSREIGKAFSYGAGLHKNFSIWIMILYDFFCWAGTVQYSKQVSG